MEDINKEGSLESIVRVNPEIPKKDPFSDLGESVDKPGEEKLKLGKTEEANPFLSARNTDELDSMFSDAVLKLNNELKIKRPQEIEVPKEKMDELRTKASENQNDPGFIEMQFRTLLAKERGRLYSEQKNIDEYKKRKNSMDDMLVAAEEIIGKKEWGEYNETGVSRIPVTKTGIESISAKESFKSEDEKITNPLAETAGEKTAGEKIESVPQKLESSIVNKEENKKREVEKKDLSAESLKKEEKKPDQKKEGASSFIKKNLKEGVESSLGFSLDRVKNTLKEYPEEEDEMEIGFPKEEPEPYTLEASGFGFLEPEEDKNDVANKEAVTSVKEEPTKLSPKSPQKSPLKKAIEENKTESEMPSASKSVNVAKEEPSPEPKSVKKESTSGSDKPFDSSNLEKKIEELVSVMKEIRTTLRTPLLTKNVDRVRDY